MLIVFGHFVIGVVGGSWDGCVGGSAWFFVLFVVGVVSCSARCLVICKSKSAMVLVRDLR